MNLYDMMTIVNGVVDKVCFVNDDMEFEYHPELKKFYMWLYYSAFVEDKPNFEIDGKIDENKAFDYFVNQKGAENICKYIPLEVMEIVENAVDEKIKFIIENYKMSKSVSLTDVALSNFINLISDTVSKNGNLIDEVGNENIKKFISKYVEKDKGMSPKTLVKAMKDNGLV